MLPAWSAISCEDFFHVSHYIAGLVQLFFLDQPVLIMSSTISGHWNFPNIARIAPTTVATSTKL